MYNKDIPNLKAILDSIQKIQDFTQFFSDADAFYVDQKSFDAVLMNFIIIGESANRVSLETQTNNSEIPWVKIKGLRNIVAHNYFGVDAEEVWQIIIYDLSTLKTNVNKILSSFE